MGNGCLGPRLPKSDLQFLLENTSFTEAQIHQWHIGFMKDCPSGALGRDKFLLIYEAMFPDGRASAFYGHVFRSFDEDGSGNIDFKEFLQAIDITQNGLPGARLGLAFRLYDIDRSGTVEAHEMTEIIKAIHLMGDPDEELEVVIELAEQKAHEIFSRIDADSDGHMSRDEFFEACMEDDSLYKMLASGETGLRRKSRLRSTSHVN